MPAKNLIIPLKIWAVAMAMVVGGFSLAQQPALRRGQPIVLNFQDADIESVARTLSVITGRSVVVDPRVQGNITLRSENVLGPGIAWQQFVAALRMRGFAVVSQEGVDKILPEAEAKWHTVMVQDFPVTASPTRARGGIVTRIFRLNHENANNLLGILRPLISPNNTINVNLGDNSLVITDYEENLGRMAKIIASADVPNATDVEIIALYHAVAGELAPLITRLLEGGTGGSTMQDATYKTTIVAESRSNALIVRAANASRLALVRSLVARLDRPAQASAGDESIAGVYVVPLKNAEAVKLAVTLRAILASSIPYAVGSGAAVGQTSGSSQAAGGASSAANTPGGGGTPATSALNSSGGPSTGGTVQADPSTNTLIITAAPPQYRQLRAIIDKLDERRAQIYIEALIAEVSTDKASEFGFQWQFPIGQEGDGTVAVAGTNFTNGGANIVDISLQGKNITSNPLGAGINFALGRMLGGSYFLAGLARFLESTGDSNILSAPNIVTLDNEEARIVVGQNVPFITGQYTNNNSSNGSVNPFQTIERKDIGLTLRVKPQISEDGTIRMQIFQEVSSLSASSASGLITNKRSIESSVLVQDGSVVVLGGLMADDYSNSMEKIPLLGDIPLVGNLFKSETRKRRKTNLMVFLRPVVMRTAASSDAFTLNRYGQMQGVMQTNQPSVAAPTTIRQAPVLGPPTQLQAPPSGPSTVSQQAQVPRAIMIPGAVLSPVKP